jgi:S1-C subfamily serine protease
MPELDSSNEIPNQNQPAATNTNRDKKLKLPIVAVISFITGASLAAGFLLVSQDEAQAPAEPVVAESSPSAEAVEVQEQTESVADDAPAEDAPAEDAPAEDAPAEEAEQEPQYQARPMQSELESGTESGFPEELLDQAVELATKMRASVVQVFGQGDGFETGAGTGWLVEPDVIATNDHVIDFEGLDAEITIRTIDGEVMTGELIITDPDGDVAFVSLPRALDAPLFTVSREQVSRGEPVIAVGHPSLIGNWETVAGVVASVGDEYWITDENRKLVDVLTTMPTSAGSSGSAIMRMDGAVVAINSKADYGTIGLTDRKPTPNVFVHTFQPRVDNNGGVSSAAIIRLADEAGVQLQLID